MQVLCFRKKGKVVENALLGKEENDSQKGTVMTKMCNENKCKRKVKVITKLQGKERGN